MEKKKLRFNVVDICIVIIAIFLVAAFAYYASGDIPEIIAPKKETMRYTVSIEGFSEEFVDLIKVGEKLKNVDRDCVVGTIVEVTPATPNISYNQNMQDGTFVAAEIPNMYRCQLVVESPYTKTNTGWRRHVHNGADTMSVHILLRYVPRAENIILEALRME